MLRTITRLLFGGEQETEVVRSGEAVEEGWLVVSHREAAAAERPDAQTDNQASNSAPPGDTVASMDAATSVSDPDATDPSSSSISSYFSQPKAVAEVTRSACVQKAKAWADRHHVSRNAIQRQNRVHQGVQHPSFHLQQPGHRNLSH